nr:unnamed protein product [Digitaria exilis]
MAPDTPSPSPTAATAEPGSVSTPLLRRRGSYTRSMSHARDELRSFRSCLRWMCIDHSSSDASSASSAASSYLVFASLAVAVPCAALAALPQRRAYDTQILRMTGFARDFGQCADVAAVLRQHRRIRVQLRRISHRYRRFILYCLILVTVSQFTALLAATRPHAQVNLAIAGELALCSMSLVTGLLICLHSAAKITHKTQSITSVAAAWHADATINSLERDQENPRTPSKAFLQHQHAPVSPFPVASASSGEESDDDESRSEDSVDTSRFASFHVTNVSFQKRQALVTYLENNRAGITVFGFVVDRTWLHALFMIEFSLVMWLLGKTIGIS